jgi:hypothetical protein
MARRVMQGDDDPDEDRYRADNLAAILDIDPAMMSGPATEEVVDRISKDLREAARRLTWQEARFLVDAYYSMQRDRIRAGNQLRATASGASNKEGPEANGEDWIPEPNSVLKWLGDQRYVLEKQVARALNVYSNEHLIGQWMRSITGIGPIIAAGLLAHIDISKARTAGNIWRFAGLDPTVLWASGEKRPWNADLKRLCFLIGESFVKTQNTEADTNYGAVYAERKRIETINNEAGHYAAQAAYNLQTRNYGRETVARKWLEQGKLPPGHLHQRARRYAVKLFLSDLQCVWWYIEYGELPERPYQFVHLEHRHYVGPPHTDMIEGLSAALAPLRTAQSHMGIMRPRNWKPNQMPPYLEGGGKAGVWAPPQKLAPKARKEAAEPKVAPIADRLRAAEKKAAAKKAAAKKRAVAVKKAAASVASKKRIATPKRAVATRRVVAKPRGRR